MAFEQKEPLTTRIGNIIKEYKVDQVLQELLQNCDDARAPHVFFLLDKREQKGPGLAQLKEVQEQALRDSGVATLEELAPDVANEEAEFLLQQFKGPALYQYDYGVFHPEDFDSLGRLGDGRKKHDPTATGKFCLGFNCTYHITDMPSFVSGEWAVFLDPHKVLWRRRNIADGTHEKVGGWKFNLKDMQEKRPEIVKTLRSLFDPFSLKFEVKPHEEYCPWDPTSTGEPWGGTCFRFPLRCKDEYLKKSQICRASQGSAQVVTAQTVEERVLIPYMHNAVERLLFMRSLESVVIYVWEEDAEKPDQCFKVSITDLDESKRQNRRAMITFVKRKMKEYKKEVADEGGDEDAQRGLEPFMRFIRWLKEHASDAPRVVLPCRVRIDHKGHVKIQHWVLSTMIGGLEELSFASAESVGGLYGPAMADQCMWPYAAVAALLAEGEEVDEKGTKVYRQGNGGVMPGVEGKAFCTLPTPIFTGLPVHLDGRWELKTDRNNLIIDTQAQGLAKLQTYWNYLLIERVGAAAYARLLQQLAIPADVQGSLRHWLAQDKVKLQPADFYRLFPSSQSSESDNIFKRIATPTFSLLSRPCGKALPVKLGETQVLPLSGEHSNNHEIAWHFFFRSEKETMEGVNFLRRVQVEERVGQVSVGKDVMDLFAIFDRDGSGYLSVNELRQGLVRVLTDSADLYLNHLIDVADKDKDNQVSKEEFADILLTNLEKAKADALTQTDVRDEFGNTSILKFRLVGIDKVTASCLASVGDIFQGTASVPEETSAQRQWKTVRDVTYQLFGSGVSVESSLLRRGVPLTDAAPEIYEELQRLSGGGSGERMHPAIVRKWYQSSEFDDNAKKALEEFACGIRWPKGAAPTHLQDEQAVILLLIYCLSDLGSRRSSVLTEIQGCVLLPLRDGSLASVPDKSKAGMPILLDTDTKDGDEAFGSRLVGAPELFLARPASRVLSALDCADPLGCAPFGPTELARGFDRVLPKAWCRQKRIHVGELTEELRQKVVTFWSFLAWQGKDLQLLANFGDWPLLQCDDGGLVQLSAVQSVVSTPDLKKQTGKKSLELQERAKLLGVLGVPLLQSSNPDMANLRQVLKSELGDAGLAPLEDALKTSAASLRWVSEKVDDVLALSWSHKQSFLRLLAQGQPVEEDLKLVRLLPLYKLQGSETTISLSDKDASYHTMPNFKVEGIDSAHIAGVVFLQEPELEWSALYLSLGITPLPRDMVYKEVFDHWHEYSQATRLQLLNDLRAHFGTIRDQKMPDGETFAKLLLRTPLFWSAADPGKFSTVLQLLDTSDLLVLTLSPMFDHCLPPPELLTEAWKVTLLDWGMPPHMPMTYVVSAMKQNGKESSALAGVVLKYIGQHCASLQQMDGEAWLGHLKELGDMKIAPNEQQIAQSFPSLKMPHPNAGEPLVPPKGARLIQTDRDCILVWSQQSLVRLSDPQPTPETLRGLGMDLEEPKPEVVAKHLKVVMGTVREVLQKAVGEEAGTEGQPAVHNMMWSPAQSELTAIYSYFDKMLAEHAKGAPKLEKLLAEAGFGPNEACIIVRARARGHNESNYWRIVEPKRVFAFCREIPDVDMYSLGYRSHLTHCSKLMSYLKITERPFVKDLVAVMRTTAAKVEEGTVDEKVQQALLALSHEIGKQYRFEKAVPGATEAVHLIDVDYKVVPLSELILDNAEWLHGRIDKHGMHLLHHDLAEYARNLDMRLLSETVTEELAGVEPLEVSVPQAVQDAIDEIRRTASHEEFRAGIWRLISSCNLKPEKLEECNRTVYKLDNLEIVPVSKIRTRFMFQGLDVTAEEGGTPVCSNPTDDGLQISIVFSSPTRASKRNSAPWWRHVAQCLATYFHCHEKWGHVKEMLSLQSKNIKALLNDLKVPPMILTHKAKMLGKPLSELDWIVGESNTSEFDLTEWLGELIAVFEDDGKEGFYWLASLLPIQESSLKEGPLNIDSGRRILKQMQRGKIFAVKNAKQLEEVRLEKDRLDALKDAEQLAAERQEKEKQKKEMAKKLPTEGEVEALHKKYKDDKPAEVPQQQLPSGPSNPQQPLRKARPHDPRPEAVPEKVEVTKNASTHGGQVVEEDKDKDTEEEAKDKDSADVQVPADKRRKVTPDDPGPKGPIAKVPENPMKPLDKTAIPEVPKGPAKISAAVPEFSPGPPPVEGLMQAHRNNDKEGTPQELLGKQLEKPQVKPEEPPPAAAIQKDTTGMYNGAPGTGTIYKKIWFNPNLGHHDRKSCDSGQQQSIEEMQVWEAAPDGSKVDIFWMDRDYFHVGANWKEIPGVGPGQLLLSPPHIKTKNGPAVACTLGKNRDDILYIKSSDSTAHSGRLRFQIARQAPYGMPAAYKTVEPYWQRPAHSPQTAFCRPIDLSFRLDEASLKEAQVALKWIGVDDGMNFWQVLSLITGYIKGFTDEAASANDRKAYPHSNYLTVMHMRKGACGNRSDCFKTTALAAGIASRLVVSQGHVYAEFLVPPPASGQGPAPWKEPWTDWRMVDLGGARCNTGGDKTNRASFRGSGAIEKPLAAEEKIATSSDDTKNARATWRKPEHVPTSFKTIAPKPLANNDAPEDLEDVQTPIKPSEGPIKPLDKTAIPEVPQGSAVVSAAVPEFEPPAPPQKGSVQLHRDNDKEGTPQELMGKKLEESQVKHKKPPAAAAILSDHTGMYNGAPGTGTVFIRVWYNPNLGVHDRLSAYSGQQQSIEEMQVWKTKPDGSRVDFFWMDRDNFHVGAGWTAIPGVGPGQLLFSPPHIKFADGSAVACTLGKNRDEILYIKSDDNSAHTGRLRFRIARQAPYNTVPSAYKTVEPWWQRPTHSPESQFCRPLDLSFRLDEASLKEAQVALKWIGVDDSMNFWQVLSLLIAYHKGFSDMAVSAEERVAYPQSKYLTLMHARKGACGNRSSCCATTAVAAGIACRMVGGQGHAYVEFLLPPPASGQGPAPWKAPWTDWRMVDLGGASCSSGGDSTNRASFGSSGAIEKELVAEEKTASFSDDTRKAKEKWRRPDFVATRFKTSAVGAGITHTGADSAALDDPVKPANNDDSVAGGYGHMAGSSVRPMRLADAQINGHSWPVLFCCSDVSDLKEFAKKGMEALQKLQPDVELCARMAEALCKSLPFAEDSLRKRLKLSIVATSQTEMPPEGMDQESKRRKLSSDASSQKEIPPTLRDPEGLHLDSADWSTSQVRSSPSDPILINVAHFAMLTEKLRAAQQVLQSKKDAAAKVENYDEAKLIKGQMERVEKGLGPPPHLIYLQSLLMEKHGEELSMIAKAASPSKLLECFGHSLDSISELSCAILPTAFRLDEVVIQNVDGETV